MVVGGGDPRAPRLRASIGSSGAAAVGRADAAGGGPWDRRSAVLRTLRETEMSLAAGTAPRGRRIGRRRRSARGLVGLVCQRAKSHRF